MAVGLLSGTANADSVSYQVATVDGNGKVTYTTQTASNATVVGSSTTSWGDGGCYVVNSRLHKKSVI